MDLERYLNAIDEVLAGVHAIEAALKQFDGQDEALAQEVKAKISNCRYSVLAARGILKTARDIKSGDLLKSVDCELASARPQYARRRGR